ncbi:MAG: hypothetical protein AB1640_21020 [bacterium]
MKKSILIPIVLLLLGCGSEDVEFEGDDAPTISTVELDPTVFPAGSGERILHGIFLYVDPNADLEAGVFLTRACGQGAEVGREVPFDSIDDRTTGVFVVSLAIDTDCEAGPYSGRFHAVDERGNRSNDVDIEYVLQ